MQFEVHINVQEAFRLKVERGFNLLNIFEGNNLDELAMLISFNDEKVLDLWWDVVSKKLSDREEATNKLTRDDLTKFKEAFWAGIINFSDRAGRDILLEVKKRLPGLLKKQASDRMDQIEKEVTPQNPNSSNT